MWVRAHLHNQDEWLIPVELAWLQLSENRVFVNSKEISCNSKEEAQELFEDMIRWLNNPCTLIFDAIGWLKGFRDTRYRGTI